MASRGQHRQPRESEWLHDKLNLSSPPLSSFRAKVFRGKKVLGDYDIRVEQVYKFMGSDNHLYTV